MRVSIKFVSVMDLLASVVELLPRNPLGFHFDFDLSCDDIECL